MVNGHAPDSLVKNIIRHKRAGDTNAEIASATGIPEHTVKNICHRRHIRLRDNGRMVFKVSTMLYDACGAEADRRRVTVSALMQIMVSKIVRDRLFDAILDDGK
jgi:hypothetical protein